MDLKLREKLRGRSSAIGKAMDDEGTFRIPTDADPSQIEFLSRSYRLLDKRMANGTVTSQCERWVKEIERGARTRFRISDEERERWISRTGLSNGPPPTIGHILQHNAYAFLQTQAADPGNWRHVPAGLLHSATQVALAEQLKSSANMDERGFTETFLEALAREASNLVRIANSYADGLPEGSFLHFFTANMQGKRDELDSDLAFVVGMLVAGKPIYRVCILQAKWRPRYGGRLSERGGRQLAGMVASGMGYYLFYPNPSRSRYDPFRFASVVPADVVLLECLSGGPRPSYLNMDTLAPDSGMAWDLPTFVSSLLGPGGAGFGRMFTTPEAAQHALRGERDTALSRNVLFFDTTGGLLIAKLEGFYVPEARTPTVALRSPIRAIRQTRDLGTVRQTGLGRRPGT